MSSTTSILRQVILLDLFQRNRGGVTLLQVGAHMAGKFQIDADKYLQRTFQRDKDAISRNYHLDIGYNHVLKTYRITNSTGAYIPQTIEIFEELNAVLDEEELSGQVIFEASRPRGSRHFKHLLSAINKTRQVRFNYKTRLYHEPERCLAEPYALKEFRGRWYLLAMDRNDFETKVYALDNITYLEPTSRKFDYPAFIDPRNIFASCFGVILPGPAETVQQVILSFGPQTGSAIMERPLHPSQTELAANEDEYRVSMDVYLTYDLAMEILSYGETVKVIAPQRLVEVVKERYRNALGRYE